jgi:hypothetical protein
VTKSRGKQKICDVKIDNSSDWKRRHLRSIRFWYGNADFFEKYFSFFDTIYAEEWEKLETLNIHIIKYILRELEIHTPIYAESDIETASFGTDRIIELCRKLNADVYLSGSGGRNYLEEDKFLHAGIELRYQDFLHPTYQQRYIVEKNPFLPCLSTIDLLFNEGPNSKKILRGETGQTSMRQSS